AQESRAVVERDPPVAPGIDGLADELAHADGEGWREGIGSERTEAEPGQPGPVAGEAEPSPEPIRIVQPDVGIVGSGRRHRDDRQSVSEREPQIADPAPPVDAIATSQAAAALACAAGSHDDVLATRHGSADVVVVAGDEAETIDQPSQDRNV